MVESVSRNQNPRQAIVTPTGVETLSSGTRNHQGRVKDGKDDPVLDAVVAKLRSVKFSEPKYGSGIQDDDDVPQKSSSPCDCERSLKLILCGVCGLTFPGRRRISCIFHPDDIYLLDVEECKGCKEGRKGLVEFEMPEGMKEGFKNPRIK